MAILAATNQATASATGKAGKSTLRTFLEVAGGLNDTVPSQDVEGGREPPRYHVERDARAGDDLAGGYVELALAAR